MITDEIKVVCIVQARMGSSRLPGKVLKKLDDKTVLSQVLVRLGQCELIDKVVVATTTEITDDILVDELKTNGVAYYRGSEQDVLNRYYLSALEYKADVVVRVTSDCPLIDFDVVDQVVNRFLLSHSLEPLAYVSNTVDRTYPRGLDVEVFSFAALAIAEHEAKMPHEREHVTPFIWKQPGRFPQAQVTRETDLSMHRWTLDTDKDWQFLTEVFNRLRKRDGIITTREVLMLLEDDADLYSINNDVKQKQIIV